LATALWLLFFILKVISFNFSWSIICGSGVALTGFNLWSFYKCSSKQIAAVKGMATQVGTKAALYGMK